MERGLLLFNHVRDAFVAESILKKNGFSVKVVIPPKDYVRGCDLAVEININERLAVERTLKENGARYTKVISIEKFEKEIMDAVKVTDFGDTIMFRCGSMKLTIDKMDGTIVNISGGGCPDVPYLFVELVGKKLREAKRPRDVGYSLCAYSLDRAYEEAMRSLETSYRGNSSN
jgi:hypothetical protein